ncbi:MAG: hypothetical protein HKO92_03895 [Flavobacteriaceae bacterium]|nr:hypothetical protein [Bacteroidia bacterium]NNK82245.1 hypothetical protein [Flavobacteriaceae bacterium]
MKLFTKISALLLAIVAILHLIRVIYKIDVTVDEIDMPMWISFVGFIVPAILSIGLLKEAKK